MKSTIFFLAITWVSLASISNTEARRQAVDHLSPQENREEKITPTQKVIQYKGSPLELVSVGRTVSWSVKDLNEWIRTYDDISQECADARNAFPYVETVKPKKRDHELIVVRLKVNLDNKLEDFHIDTAAAQLRDGSGKLYPSSQVTKMSACKKPVAAFDVIFGVKKGTAVRSFLLSATELELNNP
ncbi:MAG: hypothetical protein L0229_02110 [Blastocatellia bacterium]|nr:hypothetical protein [Blastocatellia bacterium]